MIICFVSWFIMVQLLLTPELAQHFLARTTNPPPSPRNIADNADAHALRCFTSNCG